MNSVFLIITERLLGVMVLRLRIGGIIKLYYMVNYFFFFKNSKIMSVNLKFFLFFYFVFLD